jgi:hypothetical protein
VEAACEAAVAAAAAAVSRPTAVGLCLPPGKREAFFNSNRLYNIYYTSIFTEILLTEMGEKFTIEKVKSKKIQKALKNTLAGF